MDREGLAQRRIGLVDMMRHLAFHHWLYEHGYYREDSDAAIFQQAIQPKAASIAERIKRHAASESSR